jgi:DNA-binding protein HU-beta
MALIGKEDLVHEVAERSGLGIAEARRALEEMLGAIETQLGEGNEVRLTGFGKFSVSRRKAREGRNPQTGEPIQIAAKKVPHFTAGAELKKAVPRASQGASRSKTKPAAKTTKTRASASSKTNQAANVSDAEAKTQKTQNSKSPTGESPNQVERADTRSGGTTEESRRGDETRQDNRKRPKRTRRGPKIPRKPTMRKGEAAPEDKAAPDSGGADEGESVEPSTGAKAVSVTASGAKVALVTAAGLAAGVAGGLAFTHKRK